MLRQRLGRYETEFASVRTALAAGRSEAWDAVAELVEFQRDILLRNPLLDFDRILLLQREFPQAEGARSAMGNQLGVGSLNSHANVNIPRRGVWSDRLMVLTDIRGSSNLQAVYDPRDGRTIIDPVLDFDAGSILFAMEGVQQKNWRLFEIAANGSELRQVTPDDGADVSHFDPCYLADGNIIFMSTAPFMGLPSEFGGQFMASLFRLDREPGKVRQLSFDQDSSWSPTPLANGRVLYQRWEYSDIAHSNSRMLFHMNPNGTDQREYWGSGSYFPPSFFYAKPIPDQPRMVIGVAGGHHGTWGEIVGHLETHVRNVLGMQERALQLRQEAMPSMGARRAKGSTAFRHPFSIIRARLSRPSPSPAPANGCIPKISGNSGN